MIAIGVASFGILLTAPQKLNSVSQSYRNNAIISMIIITEKFGQLGNRLILFSHFVAFAIEHGFTVANLAFDEYAPLFQTTSRDLFCRYPHQKSSFGRENQNLRWVINSFANTGANLIYCSKINSKLFKCIKIEPNQDCLLDSQYFLKSCEKHKLLLIQGFRFRYEAGLLKHADGVREFFKPQNKHQNNIDNLINNLKQSCEILVGVHIRHGDYRHHQGGKNFFAIEQYLQVMKKVANLFSGLEVAFLVCSDAKHDEAKFSELKVFLGNDHLLEDMYSLAKCDLIIGPMSTYSTWASFYGKVPLYRIYNPENPLSLDNFKVYVPGMDYKYPNGLTINSSV